MHNIITCTQNNVRKVEHSDTWKTNRHKCTWFTQSMGYVHQTISSCNIYLSRIITICNVIVSIISSYRMKDYDWLKVILCTPLVLLQFYPIASTQTLTRYITPNVTIFNIVIHTTVPKWVPYPKLWLLKQYYMFI